MSHSTVGLLTAVIVWLGHVSVTGAELAIGSGSWVFQATLMDPTRRGEYGGVGEVGKTVSSFWTPAAYTYAAMRMGEVGWLLIAGWVGVGAAGLHPSARAAERFAAAHFPRAGGGGLGAVEGENAEADDVAIR